MTSARWYAAVAAGGIVTTFVLPLSAALPPGDVHQARLLGAALIIIACAACGLVKNVRPIVWTSLSIAAAAAGIGLLVAQMDANASCVATYDGRLTLIGRRYTKAGADYANRNAGASAKDLLLDAGGVADRIWTAASISSCRFWLAWGGPLAVTLFAGALAALIAQRGFRFRAPSPAATPPRATPGAPPTYDAFLSYRHAEPDTANASALLEALESRGLRVAIDARDFAPNQHFLSEMERCIRESRFVLCVITPRYIDSDNCSEEAIITKTLDMADRRKRLVPLLFEAVDLPVWLHGLVGIDFTPSARIDPLERLHALLTTPHIEAKPG
jgi:hypothetical protein